MNIICKIRNSYKKIHLYLIVIMISALCLGCQKKKKWKSITQAPTTSAPVAPASVPQQSPPSSPTPQPPPVSPVSQQQQLPPPSSPAPQPPPVSQQQQLPPPSSPAPQPPPVSQQQQLPPPSSPAPQPPPVSQQQQQPPPVPLAQQPPTAPKDLMASSRDTRVYLEWKAPSSGGGTITHYQFRKKPRGSHEYHAWKNIPNSGPGGSNNASFGVGSLTNNHIYYFQVRAVNSARHGPASREVGAKPSSFPRSPNSPRLIGAIRHRGNVHLTWDPPTDDGGSPIVRYGYYIQHDGSNYDNIRYKNIPESGPGEVHERSYLVEENLARNSYHFFIIAFNMDGQKSDHSRTYSVNIPYHHLAEFRQAATSPRSPPHNLTGTARDKEIYLKWGFTSNHNNGGKPITHHQYRKKAGTGSYESWVNIPNSAFSKAHDRSYMVTGLQNNTEYTFQVRSVNSVGESSASNEVALTPRAWVRPPLPRAPLAPQAFTAENTCTDVSRELRTHLSWKSPLDSGTSPITKYQYRAEIEGWNIVTQDWTDIPPERGTLLPKSHSTTDIHYGLEYTFKVRAVSKVSPGLPSTGQKVTPKKWRVGKRDIGFQPSPKVVAGIAGSYKINPYRDIPSLPQGGTCTIALTEGRGFSYEDTSKVLSWPSSITVGAKALEGTIQCSPNNLMYCTNLSNPSDTTPPPPHDWTYSLEVIEALNTLSTQSKNGSIVLSWKVSPMGTVPHSFEYRKKAGTNNYRSWTPIPNSGAGQANRESYSVSSANGVMQTFELRAKSSPGTNATFSDYNAAKGMALPALTNFRGTTGEADPGTGGSRWVRLSWNRMSSSYRSFIAKYVLEASMDGGTTWFTSSEFNPPRSALDASATHTYIGTELGRREMWKFRISAKTSSTMGEIRSIPSSTLSIRTSNFNALNERIANGEIRLIHGGRDRGGGEGVAQFGHSGSWRAICHDSSWGIEEAQVACRRAGYPGATSTKKSQWTLSSPLRSAYWLANVRCNGEEQSLLNCGGVFQSSLGQHNCQLTDAVHITCTTVDADNNNNYTVGPPEKE